MKQRQKKKDSRNKNLKDEDIILNLEEMSIGPMNSFSSSGCSGSVGFYIDCQTEHGYTEDPNFTGKMKVLEVKKSSKKGVYILKIKFEKEKEDDRFIP